MTSPILFLDALLLAAAAFPAGFSAALAALRGIDARQASPAFLALLVLPFALIVVAVGQLDPARLAVRPAGAWLVALAILAAPACIALEATVQSLTRTGSLGALRRPVALHPFWREGPGLATLGFVLLIAAGEELVYRQLAYDVFRGWGLAPGAAILGGALLYGFNHLYFGAAAVLSKTLVGLVFAGLYVGSGGSLVPPLIAHGLQSLLLLQVAGRRHA